MSETVASLYPSLASFSEPAYTYIIRLPWDNWEAEQANLQACIKGGLWHNLLGDEEEHKRYCKENHVRPEHLYTMQYTCSLGSLAFHAVREAFGNKQNRMSPDFDAYVQVECTQTLHIHIVCAGTGLNKYSAKAFRALIECKFFDLLKARVIHNLGLHYESVENLSVTVPLDVACRNASHGNKPLVSILQYRARNGDMYACRVDPRTYITNYMLPKNFKPNAWTTAEEMTPPGAFFEMSSKVYAYTVFNGREIPIHIRKDLWERMSDIFNNQQREPVFGGDPYGELPKVQEAKWLQTTQPGGKMTKRESLMLDLMNRALTDNLLTYEQLVGKHPELVVMMESQPGGARLIEQTLHMIHIKVCQSYSALDYVRHLYPESKVQPDNKVFRLLNKQGYNSWQVGHWVCCVLAKRAGKQNTINLFGPASTGKTNLAKAIVNTVRLYGCVNHQNKSFVFNDCAAKLVIWWEECVMHADWVEQAKCCLGGTEFRIDRKHKDSQLLPQTPVVISTNNNIYEVTGGNTVTQVHAKPLRDRVVQLNFLKCLPSTFGEITVEECAAWLVACSTRFECTLEGFYREWGLHHVNNDFELQKLCASHSQDFVLDEHGLCLACGGYLPLRSSPAHSRDSSPDRSAVATPGGDLDTTGETTLSDLLSTPVKMGTVAIDTSFDLCLLESPGGSEPRASTPVEGAAAEEPERKRPRLDVSPVSADSEFERLVSEELRRLSRGQEELEDDVFEAVEQGEREAAMETVREREQTPESQSAKGLTPEQWGQRLGIIPGDPSEGQSPTVLHCFENMPESEGEEDAAME